MWTRKELKAKAKASLKRNYWKTVLIALVFTIVCSGAGAFGTVTGGGRRTDPAPEEPAITAELSGTEVGVTVVQGDETDDAEDAPLDETQHTIDLYREGEDGEQIVGEVFGHPVDIPLAAVFAVTGVLIVVFLVVVALALTVSAFLANPVEVGTARFFTRNLNRQAEVKEVAFGFDHSYLQTVKTLFWRDLRILLWGLLLIVPGIVKAYEYRMMPYLLADDPTLSTDEAFAQSKRMMDGNKWRAFVLDLSFIGWYLLAIPTLGLITIFYASPYKKMTDAALYEELRYGQEDPQEYVPLSAPATGASTDMPVPVPPFAAADAPALVWEDESMGIDGTSASPVVPDDPQA